MSTSAKRARQKANKTKSLATGQVVVGWLNPGDVKARFMESVLDLVLYDSAHNKRLGGGGGYLSWKSSANVSHGRNEMCNMLLDHPGADWLLMLDSDMTFEADLLDKLMAAADPVEAPIVGGLCFGYVDGETAHAATLYGHFDVETGVIERYNVWPEDKLFKVMATGAACLLIHRSVLEKIRDHGFSKAYPFFQEGEINGHRVGEDITFCLRAGVAGFPVFVHTGVQLGHVKNVVLNTETYYAQFSKEALNDA